MLSSVVYKMKSRALNEYMMIPKSLFSAKEEECIACDAKGRRRLPQIP